MEQRRFTRSYCHVLIAKIAVPMARLTMCNSSDEEIIAVFLGLVGIARRQESDKEDPPCRTFCDKLGYFTLQEIATEADSKQHADGKYDVTQLANQKASLPVLIRTMFQECRTGPALHSPEHIQN